MIHFIWFSIIFISSSFLYHGVISIAKGNLTFNLKVQHGQSCKKHACTFRGKLYRLHGAFANVNSETPSSTNSGSTKSVIGSAPFKLHATLAYRYAGYYVLILGFTFIPLF